MIDALNLDKLGGREKSYDSSLIIRQKPATEVKLEKNSSYMIEGPSRDATSTGPQ